MEEAIRQIEKDLALLLREQIPPALRKELKDDVDLRAARLVILSLQWASVGYQSALRFAGVKLGLAMGIHFESREISLIFEDLKKLFEGLKWGKVGIEVRSREKKFSFRLFDSLTSAGVEKIGQNLCFFEEGFIEGILDGIMKVKGPLTCVGFEEPVNKCGVRETKCVGLGNDFCEFTVTLGS